MTTGVATRARTTWVGQSRKRVEDHTILLGGARYTDDFDPPGVLEVAFLRSEVPHATIASIDTSAAARMPGVHAVFTGEDLSRLGFGELAIKWIYEGQRSLGQPLFATGKVRFVGEPVAAVVAESRYLAEDAAEQIAVDYEPLDAVADVKSAIAGDAPKLYGDWPDNVMLHTVLGGGDFERAAAEADLVLREEFSSHRHTAVPMEGRGAVASVDPHSGILSVHTSNQAPHRAKTHIAEYLRWPEHRIRVIAPHVGGGFGVKDRAAVEEVFVALAATQLGRPVKWIEDRREHFLSTNHARQQTHQVEVFVRADGRILGLRNRLLSDIGAYASTAVGLGPSITTADLLIGPYDIPSYEVELLAIATNKVPSGGYRGFGQPQGAFVMERIIDRIAAELRIDPAEVRRRNFVASDAFPYKTATEVTYDSGDYETALDRALELIGYEGWREKQAAVTGTKVIGIGLSSIVEMTGEGPSPAFGRRGSRISGYEHASVELDSQGCATVALGLSPQGQGHETVFAQVCADELGIHPERVRVVQGDTAMTPYAVAGAIGSRGATLGSAAVITACRRLRTRLLCMAAHMLGASPEDLDIIDGFVCHRENGESGLDLAHVASELLLGHDLPDGLDAGLIEHAVFDPKGLAISFGSHAAVVEVDVDTGLLEILDYVIVYDAGRVINPMIAGGQLVGGLAQGVGAALLEELVYDADAQLTTTTFMDYLLPTAVEVPPVRLELMETPSPLNPGGVKGLGQGSTIAAPAAIANAVEDALRSRGAVVRRTPLSPDAIWSLARERSATPETKD